MAQWNLEPDGGVSWRHWLVRRSADGLWEVLRHHVHELWAEDRGTACRMAHVLVELERTRR